MQTPTTYQKKVISDKILMSTTQPFYDIQCLWMNSKKEMRLAWVHNISTIYLAS